MTKLALTLIALSACGSKDSAKKLPAVPADAKIALQPDGSTTLVIDMESGYQVRMPGVPDDVKVDRPNPASEMGPSVLVAKSLDRGLLMTQFQRFGDRGLASPAAVAGFYTGVLEGARDFGGATERDRKISDVTIADHPGKLLEATLAKDGHNGRLRLGVVYVPEKRAAFVMTATVGDDTSAEDGTIAEHWVWALDAR